MVECMNVAHRDENIARTSADPLGSEFSLKFKVELIHLDACGAPALGAVLGDGKDDVQEDRKYAAGHGGHRFGEQVDDGNQKQSQRDEPQPHGDLHATEMEVQRNLKFTLAGAGVAENEHREAIHRETPNHAKGVKVREKGHVTMADDDGDDLQRHDDIDDAIACAEALVWLPEPFAERSEEHTSELQSRPHLVCRLLLEKKKKKTMV